MKRICVVGAAMAALFTAGIVTTSAMASTSSKQSSKKTTSKASKPVKISCALQLVTQVPPNDVTITQGATSGDQYGTAGCGKPLFRGVEHLAFTTDDEGNLSGTYTQWFNTGSVHGTFTLTPDDNNPPTTTSFTSSSYTGNVTVASGTGVWKGATATGTMKCSTADSAHYSCTETLKMTQTTPLTITAAKS